MSSCNVDQRKGFSYFCGDGMYNCIWDAEFSQALRDYSTEPPEDLGIPMPNTPFTTAQMKDSALIRGAGTSRTSGISIRAVMTAIRACVTRHLSPQPGQGRPSPCPAEHESLTEICKHFANGRKTKVRQVPPIPEQKQTGLGFSRGDFVRN